MSSGPPSFDAGREGYPTSCCGEEVVTALTSSMGCRTHTSKVSVLTFCKVPSDTTGRQQDSNQRQKPALRPCHYAAGALF
jgi:hypothetical protein